MHAHECRKCGLVWSHPDRVFTEHADLIAAHRCPRCGRVQLRKAGAARPVPLWEKLCVAFAFVVMFWTVRSFVLWLVK